MPWRRSNIGSSLASRSASTSATTSSPRRGCARRTTSPTCLPRWRRVGSCRRR
jgi:hypothetical protein